MKRVGLSSVRWLFSNAALSTHSKCNERHFPPPPCIQTNNGRISFANWVSALDAAATHMEEELADLHPANLKKSVVIPTRYRDSQDAARRMGATAVSLGLLSSLPAALAASMTAAEEGEGFPAASAASAGTAAAAGATARSAYPLVAVDGLRLHGPAPSTSYAKDIGVGEDNGPCKRPVRDPLADGYCPTTRDLASGTSLLSKHPSGYGGHVPSLVGGHAPLHGHGLGLTKRDTFNAKTNLSETFLRRVPGYGGHVPRFSYAPAVDADIPGGQFAPTISAARDHVITAYWKARAEGGGKAPGAAAAAGGAGGGDSDKGR